MEKNNIILLRHHPMNVLFSNPFYVKQVEDDLSEYVIVDVTSRCVRNKEFMKVHPNFEKEISPFYIGPVTSSDGVTANIFEIFWQCGKVYPCHDDNGTPKEDFFKWRNDFYSKKECSKDLMRHACKDLGYEHKDTLYLAYYDKDKKEYIPLDYVESRKKVYIPEYCKLVYNTDSFKWLKSLVDEGKKVALVDFDAYNYYYDSAKGKMYDYYKDKCSKNGITCRVKEEDFVNIETLKDVVNFKYLAAGHAVALKALLQGDIVIEDGKVVDKVGLLD